MQMLGYHKISEYEIIMLFLFGPCNLWVRVFIMHNYNVLDGLNLYIYAKFYNVGNGITVYDLWKVLV